MKTIEKNNHEKAAVYKRHVSCANCINYNKCSSEIKNPEIKHTYGNACYEAILDVFEKGLIDNYISGIEFSLDWNIDVSQQDMNIYHTYMKIMEINSGTNNQNISQ